MRYIRLTAVLLLAACGDGGTTATSPPTPATPVATSITLSATTLSLASLGETSQLTATVKDQNGATMSGATVTWATSDAAVTTVSSTGLVTSVADGTATITATSGSASATASVTVAQVAATLSLSDSTLTFASLADTIQLTATVTDASGETISGATVTWATSDAAVATVSSTGLVTSIANGTATITATSGSLTATASVTVQLDVTGQYYVAVGGVPRYRLSLNQTESSVTFSLEREGTSLTGTGTVDGRSVSLTTEGDAPVSLTLSLEFSAELTSFTGTWDYTTTGQSSNGTVTGSTSPWTTYDVTTKGLPLLIEANYIDLEPIDWVSLFRSSSGHDFIDDFEVCRSMKHYFNPISTVEWSEIEVYSPINGTIVGWSNESDKGTALTIESSAFPGVAVTAFHVSLTSPPAIGDTVAAGDLLGTHYGSESNSDIAVGIVTPDGYMLVSYFDVMTDDVFRDYEARGASSRSDFVITAAERDADPLTCEGEEFSSSGTLPQWFDLNVSSSSSRPQ